MERILTVLDRSMTGSYISEENWDLEKVAFTTSEIVKKYGFSWDLDVIIPTNPNLIEKLFKAGIELAEQLGVFVRDTNRIIKFDKSEIMGGLERMPQSLILGEGNDVRHLFARSVMDRRPPLVWGGSPGVPFPEELFLPIVTSYAQEKNVDMLATGSLATVNGRQVRTGTPLEILATRSELKLLRKAINSVGRTGMGLMGAESSVSEYGDLAVANPDYLRPVDAHLIAMQNELKVDFASLAKAANSVEYGMRNSSLPCVIVGGLGGDAPGAAVINIASFLLSNLVCLADFHSCHPIHIRHVATTTRSVMWVQSAVSQAFAKHAPGILFLDIYPKSGTLTPELLYEVAANAVVNTVSGGHLKGPASADGLLPHCTGLEARWMGEVGLAVTEQALSLEEANKLVLKLLSKYEFIFDLPNGNHGKPFDQAYDLDTLQPTPQWEAIYIQVKEDMRALGLKALN